MLLIIQMILFRLRIFFMETLFNKFIAYLLTDCVGVDILKIIQPMFCHFIVAS
jgi:hypothetical protein